MAYRNAFYDPKLAYQNAASGFAAGQGMGTPDQFQMDDGQVLGATASGFMQGGPIGALAGGLTSFFKQDGQLKTNTENVNTSFDVTNDMYGNPVYDSQGFSQGFSDFRGLTEATRPGGHALRPRRRRQMMKKAGELYHGIQQGQQTYNTAESAYRDRNIQMQEYAEKMNDNSRLYNIYNR